jgi:chemotaxis protein histidine kinase CheA
VASHVDPALLEMFAAEVETHMAALNDGVLALEQNPDQSERFEALMRAAHSIKGAAKLVGLPAAVEIAHVIEDCFVAAREGRLAMTSGLADVLLEGVDLLGRAAQFDIPPEQRVTEAQIASTTQRITQASTNVPSVARQDRVAASSATPPPPTSASTVDFHPHGAIDASWAGEVHAELADAIKTAKSVHLDLGGVTGIDPVGLALLTLAARSPDSGQSPLRLANVPSKFEPLLRSVGLSRSLDPATEGG